jgi:hypothetical protein
MKTILKWFAISLIALASINLDTLSINFIENIETINSIITIGGLVDQQSKKSSLKNNSFKYEFKNIRFTLDDEVINFKDYLEIFITETGLAQGEKIGLITQLSYANQQYITLGNRYPILINDRNLDTYAEYIQTKFNILSGWYKDLMFIQIIFNFTYISDKDYSRMSRKEDVNLVQLPENNFEDIIDLPLNPYYNGWGLITEYLEDGYKIQYKPNSLDWNIIISKDENITTIQIFKDDMLLKTVQDKSINNREFIRIIDNKEYHIKDGKIYFVLNQTFNIKYFSKLNPMKEHRLKLITFDTETYLDENDNMQLYCICFFDGENKYSFYITDYNNISDMLKDVFENLFQSKYNNHSIYIHNASSFDLIFLLKYISTIPKIKLRPLFKDGQFINLDIELGSYKFSIKDSLLLLPGKLEKLAKSFGTSQQKLDFDHTQINQNNLLEMKEQAIKYCIADCVALFEVITIFHKEVYDLFKIDISKTPTLPSLAFRIFRTYYLGKYKIPIIKNKLFEDLSKAYYGGHVDMYIPEIQKGQLIRHYDVNSLYPSAMKNFKSPTKLLAHFIGDIENILGYKSINPLKVDKYVGVLKVKVTAPSILHPLLPHKVNNTTIYGQGQWIGWYYSEELLNAMKFGYKFEVLAGYIFETADIFSTYVDKMYQMKAESPKESPNYLISKLLMNSLYGRFGMSPVKSSHYIVDSKFYDEIIQEKGIENINEIIELNNKTLMNINDAFVTDSNINIAIALAVTANARVAMSKFKNNPTLTGKLYYTDTDSIFIEKELPKYMVNETIIGMMKLEHVLNNFISLGPKVYGGITIDGKEFTKVKGFKENISFSTLKFLLFDNKNIILKQNKWFKSLTNAMITIKPSDYRLTPNNNKRELIYKSHKLIGTRNKVI